MKIRVTEYLDLDMQDESWHCNRCQRLLGPASENYKRFLVVAERDPRDVHPALIEPTQPGGYTLAPDPEWCRIVEFYCPECAAMMEVEYLPPGHPLTHDIELDLPALRAKYLNA